MKVEDLIKLTAFETTIIVSKGGKDITFEYNNLYDLAEIKDYFAEEIRCVGVENGCLVMNLDRYDD